MVGSKNIKEKEDDEWADMLPPLSLKFVFLIIFFLGPDREKSNGPDLKTNASK